MFFSFIICSLVIALLLPLLLHVEVMLHFCNRWSASLCLYNRTNREDKARFHRFGVAISVADVLFSANISELFAGADEEHATLVSLFATSFDKSN